MIIIGAGMSGLLAGALNPGSVIYEAGPERESDHKALFRCKTGEIGKYLGIPFKEVEVHKSIWLGGKEVNPSPRIAHMYSQKVSGKITGRSITDISPGTRFIPPGDFIDQLRKRCQIEYDCIIKFGSMKNVIPNISTISMPAMAKMLGVEMPPFTTSQIYTNQFKISGCDSYCTIYYPSNNMSLYRASITGDILIVESINELKEYELDDVCNSLGIDYIKLTQTIKNHRQELGKISPIDDKTRKEFITKLTLDYNIYSLGRFATWRPKVMLDDVLEDIFVIRRLIEGGNYSSINHKQNDKR